MGAPGVSAIATPPLLLVLDPTIRLSELLERTWLAWWVPDNTEIRALVSERDADLAERIRSCLPITLVPLDQFRDRTELLRSILQDIDEHHSEFTDGPWETIVVLGVELDGTTQAVFALFGGSEFTVLPGGFSCRRTVE
jgi:hypothetical protein